jgi:hypothetical protein
MMLDTKFNSIVSRIESISDEKLLDIVSIFKAFGFVIALFFVVVVWDTLPSLPPIRNFNSELSLVVVADSTHLKIVEDYKILKQVEIAIHRTLVGEYDSLRLPSSKISHSTGEKADTLMIPMYDLDKGEWCVQVEIKWINGLSLFPHSHKMKTKCFEV